jgi:hypothetical protein
MTKTEQDHNKYMYPKLMLNKLKIMWDSTSIYTHWHITQGSFFLNFQLTCDPYSTMCGPCPSMWKLIMNYELTNN